MKKMAGASGRRDRSAAVDKRGDLIELESNLEPLSTGDAQASEPRGGTDADEDRTPTATTSASATEEALLNERFPVRGRMRNAYGKSGSG